MFDPEDSSLPEIEPEADFPDSSPLAPEDSVRFYLDLYKTAIDVQKHFNDIEWKIRGLALTVATFALGAAGVAAQSGTSVGPVSLAAAVLLLGLTLWYAFYYVDRFWYHPLLKAAVTQGIVYEKELARYLPLANMTALITARSAQKAPWMIRKLSGANSADKKMHSDNKLRWFYLVGAATLLTAALGLQFVAIFSASAATVRELVQAEGDREVEVLKDDAVSVGVAWLDVVTAISTSVAALAAVIAIVVSAFMVKRDRKRQVLRDRLQDAVALMAAFEEVQGLANMQEPEDHQVDPLEDSRARVRFESVLRASAEALPITRGTAFRHIPFGADDPEEKAYFEEAPMEGNPESDEAGVMKMRAEIIAVIEKLRGQLEGRKWSPPTWQGRTLSDGGR